ncbi:MAG: DUF484 family protein [Gammaproteobacteria bacterium]|nr:DUF484 family protein [Gammaproteobacteria bacterium]
MNNLNQLSTLVDETTVAEYLLDHPDFFQNNPQLLNQLSLETAQQGTISLVTRQQQLMREKIHNLEDEITALMSIASHNQQLYQKFSQLHNQLLDCEIVEQLASVLYTSFTEQLGMTEVAIKLFKTHSPTELHCQRSTLDNIMVQRLDKTHCYFGRINQQEQHLLFGQTTPGSVALISLGKHGELGLLAIASADPNHFEPTMDNLMLMQLCRQFSNQIANLTPP